MILWFAKYLSIHDLVVPLRYVGKVCMRNATQHLMSQNTADATTMRKQSINELGRGIQYRQANCRLSCVQPSTYAWPMGRMVVVIHSIPNRSEWLWAKFPRSCHSSVSCVLGCHSMLFKKDDLLSQRSHTDSP